MYYLNNSRDATGYSEGGRAGEGRPVAAEAVPTVEVDQALEQDLVVKE